jgi:excisionase family DNA binding protein
MKQRKPPATPVPGQITYSVPQAALILGISPALVWRFVARGEIKSHTVGARRLIHRRELERFAATDHEGHDERPR